MLIIVIYRIYSDVALNVYVANVHVYSKKKIYIYIYIYTIY